MLNSIQHFVENGIPQLEKSQKNFMQDPHRLDQFVKQVKQLMPVFRRSTRKLPTFSAFLFFLYFPLFSIASIFPIFTANFQRPFWAFFIEKIFLLCYNNSTL